MQVVHHDDYLEFIASGTFELEDAKRAFAILMDECARVRPPRMLIDARRLAVPNPISLRERFDFTVFAVRLAIDLRARKLGHIATAFLGTAEHIDPSRFGETVAANRGIRVHPTTDETDALTWLGVDASDRQDPTQEVNPPHESPDGAAPGR